MSRIYIKPIPMRQSSTNKIHYWFDIDQDAYDLSMLEKAWVNHPWTKLKNVALVGLCFNMTQEAQNFDSNISLKGLIELVGRHEACMQWNNMFSESFKNNLKKNRTTLQKHYSKDDLGGQLFQILMQGVSIFAECQYELEQAKILGERAKVNKLKRVIESCAAMKLFPETIELINKSTVARNYFDQAVMSYLPKYEFKYINNDIVLFSLSRKEKIDHANIFFAGQSLCTLNTLKTIKRNPYVNHIGNDRSFALVTKLPIEHYPSLSTQKKSFSEVTNEDFVVDVKKASKAAQPKINAVITDKPINTVNTQDEKVSSSVKAPAVKEPDVKQKQPPVKPEQPAVEIAKRVESVEREKLNPTKVAAEVKAPPAQVDTPIKNTTAGDNGEKNKSALDGEKNKSALDGIRKLNPALEALFDTSTWRN